MLARGAADRLHNLQQAHWLDRVLDTILVVDPNLVPRSQNSCVRRDQRSPQPDGRTGLIPENNQRDKMLT